MPAAPSRVIGLFPTPLLHASGVLESATLQALRERFAGAARVANQNSAQLSHTQILHPSADEQLRDVAASVRSRLVEFGTLLFGQELEWLVKELWFNVLEPGGRQAMHNHANSFVSGVIYLTARASGLRHGVHEGHRATGIVFANANANVSMSPFNGDRWVMPKVAAGDLVLFPSFLLHEVPTNQGDQRISMAFNAIPRRLDSWGYSIGFDA
jgi:uncharacterized protein (TIGR02466 family)